MAERLFVDPLTQTESSRVGGASVLVLLGFLTAIAVDSTAAASGRSIATRNAETIVAFCVPPVAWVVTTVALDVLAATVDERTYFRLKGYLPFVFRLLLPPIFYASFLFVGGDRPFRELLVATAWGSGPVLVPATLAAAGLSGPLVVACWVVGLAWSGLLWTRALVAVRTVSRGVAGGFVALLCGLLVVIV